ncbi:protein adenylyltransferase SelO family protein [uncultured Cohaesibacter sp.]|uniref:protein adenylyltransferase SelO n=1 Tax=uncultured Cohaesibacter sp. TaxID=1002546 RepID=UPI0029C7777C|nr:YdiU family protein [uncultured Cohaesibacter sp.]
MDQPFDTRPFPFDNSYARDLEGFYVPWQGSKAPKARIALLNEGLAASLGLDLDASDPMLAEILAGSETAEGSMPLAQAYAGHQFGGFSAQLGDGRALLLGELLDGEGQRFDLHLKGSGPTPFSRGGDGKAVLGPVLREYLMGEAMHALGIPTTRALAAVTTGELVPREGLKPGAVLVRVAASHLRVGTFQFFAARQEWDKLKTLADYAIARHAPDLREADNPYLALLEEVSRRQAHLIAQWMQVGFIHGVMNTDNMTISGETIDYGPCAYMDHYDPATVFSSIDHMGRYTYGNQPPVARWNLARFAETLVPLIDPDNEERAINLATDVIADFMPIYKEAYHAGMAKKIGLSSLERGDDKLIDDLLTTLRGQSIDFTSTFRALADTLRSGREPILTLFEDREGIVGWLERWQARLSSEDRDGAAIADAMDRVNPLYTPRNHLVDAALVKAEGEADLEPFKALLAVLADPFTKREGLDSYVGPAPQNFGPFVTYCGT